MIKITNPADCCGCTACASICAHKAIIMKPDKLGFLYPEVDMCKCIDCGLCEKVCSFNDHYDTYLNLANPIAYAARHKDMNEIETSRSGAAFIALSDWILAQDGIVYGAGYKEHFRVAHKRATNKDERNEFKGSKYVQSDLTDIFTQVKDDLKSGLIVLFSGTPCQTSGLNSFVEKKLRENLYMVDIVCHGVPSPYIWRDYLAYLERKVKMNITAVNFRDKEKFGWQAHKESFIFNNTNTYTNTYTFYQHIMFRHSCGICHFTNLKRPSDVTIADFWGWQKTNPTFNTDDKGCSLIFINTEKGAFWFNKIKENMNIIPARIEDCMQPNLQHPSKIHPKRIDFEHSYAKNGFLPAMKRYGNMGWRYQVYKTMGNFKKTIKKIVNKL